MNQPQLRDFRHLIGVPFVSGGRDPATGLDCWGLFMAVQKIFGRDVPEVGLVCSQVLEINRATRKQITQFWQKIDAPEPGCGVTMAINSAHPDIIQHYGVMLDINTLLHCLQGVGVVLDRLDLMQDALRVCGFYRWRG